TLIPEADEEAPPTFTGAEEAPSLSVSQYCEQQCSQHRDIVDNNVACASQLMKRPHDLGNTCRQAVNKAWESLCSQQCALRVTDSSSAIEPLKKSIRLETCSHALKAAPYPLIREACFQGADAAIQGVNQLHVVTGEARKLMTDAEPLVESAEKVAVAYVAAQEAAAHQKAMAEDQKLRRREEQGKQ
ncbi:unnamed protein product, partial [Chrysoparadoxa australica]